MTNPKRGPKIVTLDIETAPIEAYVWGTFKQNIGLNMIKQDWTILSFSFKWLGQKKVYYSDVSQKEDVRDDSELLHELWCVLDECDILVGQNGRQFDVKKIMARFLTEGLPPVSPFKIVDTLEMAKQIARFTSNKQDWLSQLLTDQPKEHHNEFPGFELWAEVLKGNPRAWAVMKKYNKVDVIGCEQMYLTMLPYYEGHPNVAAYYDDDAMRCPRCGTADMQLQEKPALTNVGAYNRYQCGGCGGFARDRYTINSKAKRKALLTS
jgi:hypothetical protein